ncbi:MAG: response regulator [Pyrinomonadaceae bacterium]|nr:response regulator [Pyrinomonadaceae bacterium]MDQ3135654.1 response regulator [Acidobacteriota bacterium]
MIVSSTTVQPGDGPVRSLFFPIRHASAQNPQASSKQSPLGADEQARSAPKPRALVVDDAPDVTEMLAILLQYAGYEVVTAFSAPQALAAARDNQFDVMVSDIGMPGMNGYELAETLRRMPDYETVPMVAVTGFSIYDRERALQSGFDAFLTKPINPQDLINLVERLLS